MSKMPMSSEGREKYSYVKSDDTDLGLVKKLVDTGFSYTKKDVSGEAIVLSSSAKDTFVKFSLENKGKILNYDGSMMGYYNSASDNDTSVVITSTALTTEVRFLDYKTNDELETYLGTGEYCINYGTGTIYGKTADGSTGVAIDYSVAILQVDTELIADIHDNVFNVESKCFSTDNTQTNAFFGWGNNNKVPVFMLSNPDHTAFAELIKNDGEVDSTHKIGIASEIVDFDTGAGTDYTGAIGVLGASPTGAKPIAVDDEGKIKLSEVDFQIGAVEIKNATTDDRAIVKSGNTFAVGDNALGVADANVKTELTTLNAKNFATETTLGNIKTNTATPTTIAGGTKDVTTAGVPEALASSTACKSVYIKAKLANTGSIYVGGSTVTSTTGITLAAGDSIQFDISNLSTVYIDSSVNGEGVGYTYFN